MQATTREEAMEHEADGFGTVPEWMLGTLDANGSCMDWYDHDPVEVASLSDLWEPDGLNEITKFAFFVHRDEVTCPGCGGCGYNEETRRLHDTYFDTCDGKPGWERAVTQDEVDALFKAGELLGREKAPDARTYCMGWHTVYDRQICVKARARRLGRFGWCQTCGARCSVPVGDWRLGLRLWVMHPRLGTSGTIVCGDIPQDGLPQAYAYLRKARTQVEGFWSGLPDGE